MSDAATSVRADSTAAHVPEWHLATVFELLADAIPDQTIMVQGDRRFSYRAYENRAARLAAALAALGARKDSKVAICLYNCPEYKEFQFAISKLRAATINVNYRYREEELIHLLTDSESEIVAYHDSLRAEIAAIRDRLPHAKAFIEVSSNGVATPPPPATHAYEDLIDAHDPAPRISRSPDDVVISYTGGTTGLPKGVMSNQEAQVRLFTFGYEFYGHLVPDSVPSLIESARTLAEGGQAPVCLVCVPFMHGTGSGVGHTMTVLMGGTVILLRGRSFDPDEALALIERERVTQMVIVGDSIARPLLDAIRRSDAAGRLYDVSSLRLIASAGVMWTEEVKHGLLQYADMKLIDFFGSTEGGMGMSVAVRGQIPPTGQFRARPNVMLLDEDGQRIPWGDERPGRLAATGNIPFAYYKDPAKTARTFLTYDGIRYSIPGDYARIAADGTITVLGRGSACINTGGEKVFAEEVEEALKRHPDVYDCLVVPLRDPRFVNVVGAVAALRDGTASEAELRDFVRGQLAGYKVPKRIFFAPEVKRAPNGKADYDWARAFANRAAESETLPSDEAAGYPGEDTALGSARRGASEAEETPRLERPMPDADTPPPATQSTRVPWTHLPQALQLILNADLMGKEFRRVARGLLSEHEINDRRASVISFLSQVGPQTINQLAHRLEQHRAAISALLIRMEGDGLIEFTPNPEDRRSKRAGLTAKGETLAAPIHTALESITTYVTEGVTEEEIETVSAVLLRIAARFNALTRDMPD